MLIQLQLQNLAIPKLELELLAIEPWIVLMNNAMVIGTDDNNVRVVVVLAYLDSFSFYFNNSLLSLLSSTCIWWMAI